MVEMVLLQALSTTIFFANDAAGDAADVDARAGIDGEVEVVTKVEAPRVVTIGIVAHGLTNAQMKDAETAGRVLRRPGTVTDAA